MARRIIADNQHEWCKKWLKFIKLIFYYWLNFKNYDDAIWNNECL